MSLELYIQAGTIEGGSSFRPKGYQSSCYKGNSVIPERPFLHLTNTAVCSVCLAGSAGRTHSITAPARSASGSQVTQQVGPCLDSETRSAQQGW